MAERTAPDPLEYEIQESRAMALGDAGRRVERALAELALGETEGRLDAAGQAVWEYLIIRESLGFHDHELALGAYGVTGRVRARVGIVRRTS